ncbi:MAG TPA: tetratricopeptide repeat protein [Opitutaceae bacterium]|nr:tetratricopeptide repeat protein [Opitutaceae bacterium]
MPPSAPCVDSSLESDSPPCATSRRAIWLAVACLVGAILGAYHDSFSGPFVFDDGPAILGNPTIRHLSTLGDVLSPPREAGQTVGGRPLVNLTLAVNYALGGEDVRGYHVFNLIVHTLAALTLFGIVRRTLLQPALRARFGSAATPLALAVALLWAVHPLLTEAVTYVIQRAESLMGLFYLLTLYCFIRAVADRNEGNLLKARSARHRWLGLSVVACYCGMATKEVMVSAPLLVLLYDRTFVAGSWRDAWTRRKYFYLSLGVSWLLLGWLVLGTQNRGGTAGLGLGDSVWTYALTQTRTISRYLQLAVWPHPLVFDYGTEAIEHPVDALPFVLLIAVPLAGTVVAWWRWPVTGFLGVWFFAILAPSSSIVPIPVQTMAEHRMYLPLAAVVALAVLSLYAYGRRGCWYVFAAVALALATLTVVRNVDYLDPRSIWADTVAKRPANARAQCYYGDALAARGQYAEALAHYDAAIQADLPAKTSGGRSILGDILVNSGNVLRALGRDSEAVIRYEAALHVDPDLAPAHFNLGCIHLQADRLPEAVDRFEQALKLDPNYVAAHTSLGSALLLEGRTTEALVHYETALRLDPSARAHQNLGIALLYARQLPAAVTQLEQAVQLEPDLAQAQEFLGEALAAQGRQAEAAAHYRRALQIEPGNEHARRALELLSAPPR